MISIRDRLLLINLSLLLLFNYGYMQIRVPQSRIGLPISELLIILTLITARQRRFSGPSDPNLWIIYLLWIGFGAIAITLSYFDHGIRAVRDGLPVIESLFIYVGFVFAANGEALHLLYRWIPRVLVIGGVYAAIYPFRDSITPLAPVVSGIQGQAIPLFPHFVTTGLLLSAAAAYCLERLRETDSWRYGLYAAVSLSLALVLVPSRTLLLMIGVLSFYFFTVSRSYSVFRSGTIIALVTGCFLGILSLGIENTRLGLQSLVEYKQLLLEILPGYESPEALTSGTDDRLRWWRDIYHRLVASWSHLLFGLGYGIPLTDLETGLERVRVYSLHNGLINVIARGGLVAGLLFIWLNTVIVSRAIRTVMSLRKAANSSAVPVALLFVLVNVLVTGIGEDPFVNPYAAVPYFFISGVFLKMHSTLRCASC